MIDLPNYQASLRWLQRTLDEYPQYPEKQIIRDAVTQTVIVTYNLTESVLRQSIYETTSDADVFRLSSGELMHFAADAGLYLSSPTEWLTYGLAIEKVKDSLGHTFEQDLEPLLPQYAAQLHGFVKRLEGRLTHLAA